MLYYLTKTLFANLTGNTGLTAVAPLEQGLGAMFSKGDFALRRAIFGGDKNYKCIKNLTRYERSIWYI